MLEPFSTAAVQATDRRTHDRRMDARIAHGPQDPALDLVHRPLAARHSSRRQVPHAAEQAASGLADALQRAGPRGVPGPP